MVRKAKAKGRGGGGQGVDPPLSVRVEDCPNRQIVTQRN